MRWAILFHPGIQLIGNRKGRAKLLIAFMSCWAVLMLVSRLRFGMHYPIDLFISVLIAWLVHWMIFAFLAKKQYFQKME